MYKIIKIINTRVPWLWNSQKSYFKWILLKSFKIGTAQSNIKDIRYKTSCMNFTHLCHMINNCTTSWQKECLTNEWRYQALVLGQEKMPGKCVFDNVSILNEKYRTWLKREAEFSLATSSTLKSLMLATWQKWLSGATLKRKSIRTTNTPISRLPASPHISYRLQRGQMMLLQAWQTLV